MLLAVRATAVAAIALCVLFAGCRQDEEIRTYRIAKPEEGAAPPAAAPDAPVAPAAPAAKPPTGEPTDRMIGAILPGLGQAWFFKAVGPKETVDNVADEIAAFLATIRFEGDQPTWNVPEGWDEEKAGGMRLATLEVFTGEESPPVELSVIGLPLTGDWDAQVLDNVNRWRKQLQLPPITAAELADETKSLATIADGAVIIDAQGWFDGGTMAPFAGGAAPFAAAAPPAAAPTGVPPGVRNPAPTSELNFETPDGWTEAPGSAMRKASLKTPGGAEVTAFAFPVSGAMGDRLENVNRWRREVKLEPVTDDELDESTEELSLLGGDGAYFELVGPEETTHAAMVERNGQVWFFKLRGPADEVAAQRDAFRVWLKSLSL